MRGRQSRQYSRRGPPLSDDDERSAKTDKKKWNHSEILVSKCRNAVTRLNPESIPKLLKSRTRMEFHNETLKDLLTNLFDHNEALQDCDTTSTCASGRHALRLEQTLDNLKKYCRIDLENNREHLPFDLIFSAYWPCAEGRQKSAEWFFNNCTKLPDHLVRSILCHEIFDTFRSLDHALQTTFDNLHTSGCNRHLCSREELFNVLNSDRHLKTNYNIFRMASVNLQINPYCDVILPEWEDIIKLDIFIRDPAQPSPVLWKTWDNAHPPRPFRHTTDGYRMHSFPMRLESWGVIPRFEGSNKTKTGGTLDSLKGYYSILGTEKEKQILIEWSEFPYNYIFILKYLHRTMINTHCSCETEARREWMQKEYDGEEEEKEEKKDDDDDDGVKKLFNPFECLYDKFVDDFLESRKEWLSTQIGVESMMHFSEYITDIAQWTSLDLSLEIATFVFGNF